MNPIQRRNLLRLQTIAKKIDPDTLDMQNWESECGTTACIGGHYIRKYGSSETIGVMRGEFGLSLDEEEELFYQVHLKGYEAKTHCLKVIADILAANPVKKKMIKSKKTKKVGRVAK